jgi:hypothetical protein
METDELSAVLNTISEQGALEIQVVIRDDGRPVSADVAATVLRDVVTLCAIGGEVGRFIYQNSTDQKFDPSTAIIEDLVRQSFAFNDPNRFFAERESFLERFMTAVAVRREHEGALLVDEEWLRLELVAFEHENPNRFTLWIRGVGKASRTMLLCVAMIVAAHTGTTYIQAASAAECNRLAFEHANTTEANIAAQEKLEGRSTESHQKARQTNAEALAAALKACQPTPSSYSGIWDWEKKRFQLGINASDVGSREE